jgi:hypothetical protein
MKQLITVLALLSTAAFSQTPAPAAKAGDAASKPATSAPAASAVMIGPGGNRPHGRMMHFNEENTPGWSLMTPEERLTHHEKMHGMKTTAECNDYHEQHAKEMAARAKAKRKAFKPAGSTGPCEMMQQQGMLK